MMWCTKKLISPLAYRLKFLSSAAAPAVSQEATKTIDTTAKSVKSLQEPNRDVNPLEMQDYFGVRRLVNVADLFHSRAHFGHRETLRNVFMTPYLFGNRQRIDIFDLNQTLDLLGDALNFVAHVAYRGGVILFICRNRQMQPLIEHTAAECGEYAHCRYWRGHAFTDSDQYYGVVTRLPDVVIFFNTLNNVFRQHPAVVEAAKMLIPTVAVVDSNCDPRLVTYPIPGNDDSALTIRLWTSLFKEAILRGKAAAKKNKELVTGGTIESVSNDTDETDSIPQSSSLLSDKDIQNPDNSQ